MSADRSFHRLSEACFTELARGSGGASSVAELRSGQRSRTMLLLRALVDIASEHPALPGPLPPAPEAWRLLIRAERRSAGAVERLLLHPQMGAWLNRCLRRLRGRESVDAALWAEVGHLHAAAASAALLAGIDFRIAVPVRDGGVMLPALGLARLADRKAEIAEVVRTPEGRAAVTAGEHTVLLPFDFAGDAPGWHGLRRLHGAHQELSCAPFLDDIDPYRDFLRTRPPERLPDDEWKHWQEHFDNAWRLVSEQGNVDPAGIAACLVSVVPVPYTARPEMFSASSPEAHGCILLSRPTESLALAASLVHEAQHNKLSALLDLVPLIEGGLEEIHYAPWRPDPRPLRGLLQGVYAFLGVTAFWQDRRHRADEGPAKDAASFEFALRRAQTAQGLRTLLAHADLTPLGERFLQLVEERLLPWLAEPVPSVPQRLAADVALDREVVYRLRHLRPDPGQTTAWARARRLRTAPPGAPPDTSVQPVRTGSLRREALARLRLMDPAEFTRLCQGGGAGPAGGGGAPERADLDWATGDTEAALRGYRTRLDAAPDDIAAWAGLALSAPDGPARKALLSRPELVLAVHRELRTADTAGPDPMALARWIGTHL